MTTKAGVADVAGFLHGQTELAFECEQESIAEGEEDLTWHRAAAGEPGSDLSSFVLWTGDGRAFRVSVERAEDEDAEPAEDYRGP